MRDLNIMLLVCVIFSLASCVKNNKFNGFVIHNIEGTKQYIDFPTNPSEMRYLTNKLVWLDYSQKQMVYSIPISLNEDEIESHNINKGAGPGEFGNILSFNSANDYISFYDGINKRFYTFNLTTPVLDLELKEIPLYILGLEKLSANRYLISGLFPEHRFLLIDNLGKTISSYATFPGKVEGLNVPIPEKNMGCINVISATKDGFASIVYDSGIIEFFRIKNDSIVKVNETIYSDIDFKPVTENGITSISRSNKNTGFIDILTSGNRVFGLYSAVDWATDTHLASHAEYVYIYDLDGKPLKAYKLQYPIHKFAIDPTSDKMYGFGSDDNGLYFTSFKIKK
jgi:hypothetical protein